MKWTLLVSLGLALAPTVALGGRQAPADRVPLEDLLGRYREQRDRLLAGLRERVESQLAGLEGAIESGRDERVDEARRQVVALGPECVPLLLPALDPGPDGAATALRRAREVAGALRELPTAAISSELVQMARTGSAHGKRNALEVLRRSEEPERVGPGLQDLFRSSTGELRRQVLVTLAHLGGQQNEAFVAKLLLDDDQDVRRSTLEALTEARAVSAAPRVLELVTAGAAAARHVTELLAYYRACPGVFDAEHGLALLRLARQPRLGDVEAVRLIELLGNHKGTWSNDLRRELREAIGSSPRDVEEAVLVVLARPPAPDSRALRQLLEPYNQEVDRRRDHWVAYRNRGDIRLRIDDHKGAIRDYQDAIKYSRDSLRPDASPYLGLARAHARTGKLRDAASWLERAPLTRAQLLALAKDPDFVELAASRYGRVFGELGE